MILCSKSRATYEKLSNLGYIIWFLVILCYDFGHRHIKKGIPK